MVVMTFLFMKHLVWNEPLDECTSKNSDSFRETITRDLLETTSEGKELLLTMPLADTLERVWYREKLSEKPDWFSRSKRSQSVDQANDWTMKHIIAKKQQWEWPSKTNTISDQIA
jgi:hypothetical protein